MRKDWSSRRLQSCSPRRLRTSFKSNLDIFLRELELGSELAKPFHKIQNVKNPSQVRLTYLSELPVEEGKIRLTIPTTVAPRWQKTRFTHCALLHWEHSTFRSKVFKPRPVRYSESTTSRYVPVSDSSVEARRISSIEHNFSSSVQVFLSSA